MLRPLTHFPVRDFMVSTVSRCLFIVTICFIVSLTISQKMDNGLSRFILNFSVTELTLGILLLTIGLNTGEKNSSSKKLTLLLINSHEIIVVESPVVLGLFNFA